MKIFFETIWTQLKKRLALAVVELILAALEHASRWAWEYARKQFAAKVAAATAASHA